MTPELKAKWVAALRSGKYQQGQSALKVRDAANPRAKASFCCLGVLCDVSGRRGRRLLDDDTHFCFDGDASYLTDNLLTEFGLTDDQQHELASMNDQGASFEEIATFIEASTNL